jgi:hypothetical protein
MKKQIRNKDTNPLTHTVDLVWNEDEEILEKKTFTIAEMLYDIAVILKELNQTIKNNG